MVCEGLIDTQSSSVVREGLIDNTGQLCGA